MIVCKGCGYACHGVTSGPRTADGRAAYAYYRCRGSEAWRFGGQKLCRNQADPHGAAGRGRVGRRLLAAVRAGRVREEYRRRLEGPREGEAREVGQLTKLINQVRKDNFSID